MPKWREPLDSDYVLPSGEKDLEMIEKEMEREYKVPSYNKTESFSTIRTHKILFNFLISFILIILSFGVIYFNRRLETIENLPVFKSLEEAKTIIEKEKESALIEIAVEKSKLIREMNRINQILNGNKIEGLVQNAKTVEPVLQGEDIEFREALNSIKISQDEINKRINTIEKYQSQIEFFTYIENSPKITYNDKHYYEINCPDEAYVCGARIVYSDKNKENKRIEKFQMRCCSRVKEAGMKP